MSSTALTDVLGAMLTALACTLVLETGAAAALGVRSGGDFLIVVLANLLTNPVVSVLPSFAAYRFGTGLLIPVTVLAELGAVLAEWLVYRRFLSFRRVPPFLLSLILNAVSYFTGVLVFSLAG